MGVAQFFTPAIENAVPGEGFFTNMPAPEPLVEPSSFILNYSTAFETLQTALDITGVGTLNAVVFSNASGGMARITIDGRVVAYGLISSTPATITGAGFGIIDGEGTAFSASSAGSQIVLKNWSFKTSLKIEFASYGGTGKAVVSYSKK